jgi:hypothetical protein
MSAIVWRDEQGFMLVSAQRTLRGIVQRVIRERPAWVVLMRSEAWSPRPLLYVFHPDELMSGDDTTPGLTAQEALGLREDDQSPQVRPGEGAPSLPPAGGKPSAYRVVQVDEDGVPRAVSWVPGGADDAAAEKWTPGRKFHRRAEDDSHISELEDLGLGTERGGGSLGLDLGIQPELAPEAPDFNVEVQLAAQGPARIAVGDEAPIAVKVELASEVLPFEGVTASANISSQGEITVILSAFGGGVEVLSPQILRLKPPREGTPSFGSFVIRGLSPGRARVAVIFQQRGAEIGTLTLAVNVTQATQEAAPRTGMVEAKAAAAPPVQVDDGGLLLIIEELERGDTLYLRYLVRSTALNLDYAPFESRPLLQAGANNASAARAYVESVYKQVTERVLRDKDDLANFAREVRAIGADLCRQLIPDDLARKLWQRRSDIGGVLVRSWEPYVPWELLQLRNPDARHNETDERFLAEYNLVRSLNGEMRPRHLTLRDWSYVAARYEFGYAKPVGAEVAFLRNLLPTEYGLRPNVIEPTIDQVLDALQRPAFDVLHIACHGEASHDDIARSTLVIGDRPGGEKQPSLPITIDARTVEAEANLWERNPLVFLNACESGRLGASLTEWGGWPRTFWERGAAAFVGTSWPVRENPASVFAETFYRSLLEGRTLAEAAGAARASAKVLKDASWLAYKVYGAPGASMKSA